MGTVPLDFHNVNLYISLDKQMPIARINVLHLELKLKTLILSDLL